MNYEMKEEQIARCTVKYPLFLSEGGEKDKREKGNAARMSRFYESVAEAVRAFGESGDYPHGASYSCVCSVKPGENGTAVEVAVRLRRRGRTVFSLSETQLWRDGVIVTKNAGREKIAQKKRNG